jgi:DNA-3-methyladenine glycosylase
MRKPRGAIVPEPEFFRRDTVTVAKELIGHYLYIEKKGKRIGGRIVETEAYLSCDDPACHASRGLTERNRTMFSAGGVAYVYFIYGAHHCLNIVTGPEGEGTAVLVRAIEPLEGIETMRRNRRGIEDIHNLANGPGKLTIAMGIDRKDDGADLMKSHMRVYLDPEVLKHGVDVVTTTRIGINQAAEKPLRFYLKGSKFISRK